jgi:hypothetical protein
MRVRKPQIPLRDFAVQCESTLVPDDENFLNCPNQPSAQIHASPDSAPESNATA